MSRRGKKPDPYLEFKQCFVYMLRESDFSARQTQIIMDELWTIVPKGGNPKLERKARDSRECSYRRMYRDAKRKLKENPNWQSEVFHRNAELYAKGLYCDPLTVANKYVPRDDFLCYADEQARNKVIALVLEHSLTPWKPKIPPSVISELMQGKTNSHLN